MFETPQQSDKTAVSLSSIILFCKQNFHILSYSCVQFLLMWNMHWVGSTAAPNGTLLVTVYQAGTNKLWTIYLVI